jgi:L-fucose mutarotase
MLKIGLIHPTIIGVLATAGHGATVLIADGNYPVSTRVPASVPIVQLNLAPGLLDAVTVIRSLASVAEFESAGVMAMANGAIPPIANDLSDLIPSISINSLERFEFYSEGTSKNLALVIVTGEQRLYGNVLLTVGAIAPALGN